MQSKAACHVRHETTNNGRLHCVPLLAIDYSVAPLGNRARAAEIYNAQYATGVVVAVTHTQRWCSSFAACLCICVV
jgi:hypothetical protein